MISWRNSVPMGKTRPFLSCRSTAVGATRENRASRSTSTSSSPRPWHTRPCTSTTAHAASAGGVTASHILEVRAEALDIGFPETQVVESINHIRLWKYTQEEDGGTASECRCKDCSTFFLTLLPFFFFCLFTFFSLAFFGNFYHQLG